MNRKELIEKELEELDSLAASFLIEVEYTLENIRKEQPMLKLQKKDLYRLLILKSWVDRYKVSLDYILRKLLPFWESFVQRRSKRMKSRGLNVRVSTLTGKKSEDLLKQFIAKDFPNGLNVEIWRSTEIERICNVAKLYQERKAGKVNKIQVNRTPKTLEKYIRQYKYKIKQEIRRRDRIERDFQKRPYRNNPFIT